MKAQLYGIAAILFGIAGILFKSEKNNGARLAYIGAFIGFMMCVMNYLPDEIEKLIELRKSEKCAGCADPEE